VALFGLEPWFTASNRVLIYLVGVSGGLVNSRWFKSGWGKKNRPMSFYFRHFTMILAQLKALGAGIFRSNLLTPPTMRP
jgi:hypothetical protein